MKRTPFFPPIPPSFSYFCHIFFPHYLISLFFPLLPSSFLFFFSPLGATLFPPLRPSLSSCFLFAAFHRGERGRMEISRRGFRCRRFIRMLQMRFGRFFSSFCFFFLFLSLFQIFRDNYYIYIGDVVVYFISFFFSLSFEYKSLI